MPHSDISIVANNSENWYDSQRGKIDRDRDGVDDRAEGADVGAGIGAGIGGAAGLLAGLGLLAIPGLGPVVAAGWLASTAVGAAAGAATGGIVGALTEAGVSKEGAARYAEGVRRGKRPLSSSRMTRTVSAYPVDGLRELGYRRLGGDEFAIIMPDIGSADGPADLARRIGMATDEHFATGEASFRFGDHFVH